MPNILIVEDDININNLLCEVLMKAGYTCEQAFSGTEAKLLLDIGHLAAAGGDVCATAGRYFDRLAAIHFKDVFVKDESIGLERWWERLCFCELGGGNRPGMIDWQGAARLLKEKNYTKWVLVEHDTHLREPLEDLKISITELKAIME